MSWRFGGNGEGGVVEERHVSGRWTKIDEMQVAKIQRDRWAAQLKDNTIFYHNREASVARCLAGSPLLSTRLACSLDGSGLLPV
jgi:hypothetical protein